MTGKSILTKDGKHALVAIPRRGKKTPEQTEAERQHRRLESMSNTELISLALRCCEDEQRAHAEYEQIESILDGRFPCEKTEESLPTSAGVATRKVANRYFVEEKHVSDLQALFGKEFVVYVESSNDISLKPQCGPEVWARLGLEAESLLQTKTKFKPTRKLIDLVYDDAWALRLESLVRVDTKVTISIQPAMP